MPILVLGKNALRKIGVNGTVKKSTQLTQILPMFTLLKKKLHNVGTNFLFYHVRRTNTTLRISQVTILLRPVG